MIKYFRLRDWIGRSEFKNYVGIKVNADSIREARQKVIDANIVRKEHVYLRKIDEATYENSMFKFEV